jgi:small subunit ribosomal protein S16
MVVIRLSRGGAKKRPFYQIVVSDKRRARDGRCIERIGHYNPFTTDADSIRLDHERAVYWLSQGAQPSDRVRKLIKTFEQQSAKPKEETAQ